MRKPDGKIVLLGDMNVGKTSLLQRYMERRFPDTVSTVGGAFYLKQWRSYNISIWDTAEGGSSSMAWVPCTAGERPRSSSSTTSHHPQSLLELEDRFLGLTDTASTDCLFAIVGNKVDLVEEPAAEDQQKDGRGPGVAGRGGGVPKAPKQVQPEDAAALYRKILKYKMLDEKDVPAAEQMCFETSAKTGHNVDLLFETLFDLVVPVISRQRAQGPPQTVDITSYKTPGQTPSGCCA
ncbi:ras-related protein Rab-17 [Prionailurus iriomotensis]